jgi:hypothetical protein
MQISVIFVVMLLLSLLFLTNVYGTTPTITITYTEPSINSYYVTFNDSAHINGTISVIVNSTISLFAINNTMSKYFNITQNTTIYALVNNEIVSAITLTYKYVPPIILVNSTNTTNYVSIKVPEINKFFVTVFNNNSQIIYANMITSLVFNFTYPHYNSTTYINVSSQNKEVISYRVLPLSQGIYIHYNIKNNAYYFNLIFYKLKNYGFTININNSQYTQGGIFNNIVYFNFSLSEGKYGLGKNNTTFSVIANNQTKTYTKSVIIPINNISTVSVSANLLITTLTNSSYAVKYNVSQSMLLLIYNNNKTIILNKTVNGTGYIYMSFSYQPHIAVLIFHNITENAQIFPLISTTSNANNTLVYRYYIGVPNSTIFLISIIEGVAIIIAAFFIYNGRAQVKRSIATNKDDTFIDRFKTQKIMNVEYTDPNLLSYLSEKFTAMNATISRIQTLEKKYEELVNEAKNKKGGEI